jgi:hypothetical protein
MLEQNSKAKFNKALLITRIVHLAFILSLIVYLYISNIIIKLHYGFFAGFVKFKEVDLLKNILYLVSALTVMVIFILCRFLATPNKIPLIPTSTTDIDEILRALTSANILIFALCASPVLYGFVLFLLDGMLIEFYFLTGLSFILLIICFPKRHKWEKTINNILS